MTIIKLIFCGGATFGLLIGGAFILSAVALWYFWKAKRADTPAHNEKIGKYLARNSVTLFALGMLWGIVNIWSLPLLETPPASERLANFLRGGYWGLGFSGLLLLLYTSNALFKEFRLWRKRKKAA